MWPTDHPGYQEYREHLIRRDQALIAVLFLTDGQPFGVAVVVLAVEQDGAFKPNESVELKDGERISLASYASRRSLKLVTAAEFNRILRERGCPKEATVQKACRAARDEAQVRKALDAFWEKPAEAVGALGRLSQENQDLYRFEEMLKSDGGDGRGPEREAAQ